MQDAQDPPAVAAALREAWDFSDPAASEARFRRIFDAHSAVPAHAAEALTQLARAQGLQGRFEEASATLNRAEAQAPDLPGRVQARILLERGRVKNSSGDAAGSAAFFARALEAAEAAGESALAIDAVHMLGIVRPKEEALGWNRRGIALAEASDDPLARKWLGPLHHNTGMIHLEAGDHADARASFEAGRAFREGSGDVPGERIGRWCVAHVLRLEGRTEEALAMQTALATEIEADPGAAPDGFVHEELAECLLALDRHDEARPEFARAHELLSEMRWLADSEPERLERLRSLAAGD